ncbi:hypothetical protein MRB53_022883 [Persea americana]|uniref:Uncharacterized protein n=1 Tax=Persea americana TaxID=3435 RepID=A0ACC2L883_PERAE|nr:hypothetical protein MRB53_022883 [Persea americana]
MISFSQLQAPLVSLFDSLKRLLLRELCPMPESWPPLLQMPFFKQASLLKTPAIATRLKSSSFAATMDAAASVEKI